MARPTQSDVQIRRHLVMSGALTALLAAVLLVAVDSQRLVIAHWIAADPGSSLMRMRAVLVGLALVGVSPLLFYALALWRLSGLSDAPSAVAPNDPARRQTRRFALLLLTIACLIPLALWFLAATVIPVMR